MFTDLTGGATAMHIHTGGQMMNGGVEIGLNALPGFDGPATDGGFQGTINLTGTRADTLLAGNFYINVHTATNPGGELRANLVAQAVPEPTSIGIIGLVTGFAFLRRRRS